jgi:hypothetical protein
MMRRWTIQFLPRNCATGIILIYSSFSANLTSHPQLGRESIALAFLGNSYSMSGINFGHN